MKLTGSLNNNGKCSNMNLIEDKLDDDQCDEVEDELLSITPNSSIIYNTSIHQHMLKWTMAIRFYPLRELWDFFNKSAQFSKFQI